MNLILRPPLLAAAALLLALGAAQGAKKDKDAAPKPEQIGTYGDWKVFHSGAGKTKICYVLAEPKTRSPEPEKAEKAYAFISERPAEKVKNELSFVMGFEVGAAAPAESKDKASKKPKKAKKDDDAETPAAGPTATIGDEDFDLIPRGNDLWVKNPAEESKAIEVMRKGVSLVITAASRRGKKTTDTYSLSGFSQAVDKALKDCAG